MKVALVRSSDDGVRSADVHDRVRAALLEAGHVVAESADVAVLLLGREPIPHSGVAVAVLPPGDRGFDEAARSVIETIVDAYVLGSHRLVEALAWITSEDRAERTRGEPRLTVIGSGRDEYGMSRPISAEPIILGRAANFARENPMRRDRMPTPSSNIARHHAQLRCVDGAIAVRDLQSTNGTLVIRRAEPARLLCPQEQSGTGHQFGPPASPWITRDPSGDWMPLQIGDHLQLPGFWRFRIDGDPHS